jgi:hypothetical protein
MSGYLSWRVGGGSGTWETKALMLDGGTPAFDGEAVGNGCVAAANL